MTMRNPGKLVILAILGLAIAASAFSVWYHYQTAERSRDFWGTATATLIAQAPEIRALRLEPMETPRLDDDGIGQAPEPDAPSIEFDNTYWKIVDDQDAAAARGVGNVRTAMVQDVSFDWWARLPDDPPNWQYALEFNDGKLWATVLFDFDSRQAALAGDRKTVLLDPAASATWQRFFAEEFTPAADSPDADKPAAAEPATTDEKPADSSSAAADKSESAAEPPGTP